MKDEKKVERERYFSQMIAQHKQQQDQVEERNKRRLEELREYAEQQAARST